MLPDKAVKPTRWQGIPARAWLQCLIAAKPLPPRASRLGDGNLFAAQTDPGPNNLADRSRDGVARADHPETQDRGRDQLRARENEERRVKRRRGTLRRISQTSDNFSVAGSLLSVEG